MAESAKKIAKDIMKTEVVKVGPETPVKEVARLMLALLWMIREKYWV